MSFLDFKDEYKNSLEIYNLCNSKTKRDAVVGNIINELNNIEEEILDIKVNLKKIIRKKYG